MATQVTINAGQGSTQVTVITGEGSTSYKVEAGSRGPTGANGATGATGATGPNTITTSTTSNLTGFIAANGTAVSGATAGATAATANTLALRDGTGGSNFAAVGATSITSSGAISATGANASIYTTGDYANISTSGANAFISTIGDNASIFTIGLDAYIGTEGANAYIYTTGTNASIGTNGINAYISTSGSNAYIQSRSTFKLYNGTYTTTLSHAPTANRAIAFPNKAGTVAMIDAETHTGAHAFSSTTRPTSAGTGTPAATSLITFTDLIERGGRQLSAQLVADETGNDNTTTLKTSATLTLALEVGLYHIESLIIVSAGTSFATVGTRQKLAFTGTGTFSGTQTYSAQNGASTSSTYPNSRGANAVDAEQLFSANSSATLRYGTLNVTVAGNLVVQWAQRTAGVGSAPTLNPPSYIRAQRIS